MLRRAKTITKENNSLFIFYSFFLFDGYIISQKTLKLKGFRIVLPRLPPVLKGRKKWKTIEVKSKAMERGGKNEPVRT